MSDPLEPLRKMVEKWHGQGELNKAADELAAALPVLEEALIAERDLELVEQIALMQADEEMAERKISTLTAEREIGPCGKHPKMFMRKDDIGVNYCSLCAELWAERDVARGEALTETLKLITGCMMMGPSPIGPLHGAGWNQAVRFIEKRVVALDPSAVKAAEEQR